MDRVEVRWSPKIQDHLSKISADARAKGEIHGRFAAKYRVIHRWSSIPGIIAPLICSALVELSIPNVYIVTMLLISACATGASSFADLGSLSNSHEIFEGKYLQLSLDLDTINVIPKMNRIAADVAINEGRLRMGHLLDTSPPI
jgi:hypothetical protein